MAQLIKKLLILSAMLIFTTLQALPSQIHASRQHKDDFSMSPEPQESALDLDIEAPYSSQDNNNEQSIGLYYNSPSQAPSPSPSQSPSPSPSPMELVFSGESENGGGDENGDNDENDDAVPPEANNNNVLPFSYSAEDDAGEFTNEYYSNEGGYHVEKKHVTMVGFMVGAVCLVGFGGFVFKRKNQKRKQYQNLHYKRDEV